MENLSLTKLNIAPINQFQKGINEKGVYFGIWTFGNIVNSIKFTHREPLNFNLFKEDNELKKKYPEFNSDYYQRLINDERTKKVIQFIIQEVKNYYDEKKETLITFPTSLILSLYISETNSLEEYLAEVSEFDESEYFLGNVGAYFDKLNSAISLPNRNVMLVVDGQHRLAGLYALYNALLDLEDPLNSKRIQLNKKLIDYAQKSILKLELGQNNLSKLKEIIEGFQFSCTILLDYDIWEQGKVFADVNFNQKPVNKSLYYDIFGSYPDPDKNDIFLAHTWTVLLNSQPDSALFKKIKLLGTGEGFFSQAFFVEALLPHLRKNGIWNTVVSDFILSQSTNKTIPKFLNTYFNSIAELYPLYTPVHGEKASAYKHILFKTTGLGALIKLIPVIYEKVVKVLHDDLYILKEAIKPLFREKLSAQILEIDNSILTLKDSIKTTPVNATLIMQNLNNEINQLTEQRELIEKKLSGEYYFSNDSKYAKGGGKGLQDKLYKELLIDLGLVFTAVN